MTLGKIQLLSERFFERPVRSPFLKEIGSYLKRRRPLPYKNGQDLIP